MPKHIFKDIAVTDIPTSDAVRKNPIRMGPFKVDSAISGGAVVKSPRQNCLDKADNQRGC